MKDAAKNGLYSMLLNTFGPSDETQFPYLPAPPVTVPAKIFENSSAPSDGIGFLTPYSGTWAENHISYSPGEYYQYHSFGTYPQVDGAGNLVRDKDNIPVIGGHINGSVSADASGRLWGFYKVYYGSSYNPDSAVTPPAGSPMPDHINLLLQTNVNAYAYAGKPADAAGKVTSKATASIPFFGETLVLTADGDSSLPQPHAQTGGLHLVRSAVDPNTGIAAVYVDGEVHTQASNSVAYDQQKTEPYEGSGTRTFDTQNPAGAGTWTFVTAGVKQDDRGVRIIPQLSYSSPTYHKDPTTGQPAPNLPAPDGSVTDDTKASAGPPDHLSTYYIAAQSGTWGTNSSYQWSSTNGQTSPPDHPSQLQGTFNPNSIPPMYVDYYNYGNKTSGTPTATEHVQIVLNDSVDGASAMATYSLNFHSEYENLIFSTPVTQYGDWQRVSASYNPGALGGTMQQPITQAVDVTTSNNATGRLAEILSQTTFGPSGETYSSQVPRSANYNLPPNQWSWVEDRTYWYHITGTADNYEAQGFIGMVNFAMEAAIHPQNPLIDFNERLVSSPTPPDF